MGGRGATAGVLCAAQSAAEQGRVGGRAGRAAKSQAPPLGVCQRDGNGARTRHDAPASRLQQPMPHTTLTHRRNGGRIARNDSSHTLRRAATAGAPTVNLRVLRQAPCAPPPPPQPPPRAPTSLASPPRARLRARPRAQRPPPRRRARGEPAPTHPPTKPGTRAEGGDAEAPHTRPVGQAGRPAPSRPLPTNHARPHKQVSAHRRPPSGARQPAATKVSHHRRRRVPQGRHRPGAEPCPHQTKPTRLPPTQTRCFFGVPKRAPEKSAPAHRGSAPASTRPQRQLANQPAATATHSTRPLCRPLTRRWTRRLCLPRSLTRHTGSGTPVRRCMSSNRAVRRAPHCHRRAAAIPPAMPTARRAAAPPPPTHTQPVGRGRAPGAARERKRRRGGPAAGPTAPRPSPRTHTHTSAVVLRPCHGSAGGGGARPPGPKCCHAGPLKPGKGGSERESGRHRNAEQDGSAGGKKVRVGVVQGAEDGVEGLSGWSRGTDGGRSPCGAACCMPRTRAVRRRRLLATALSLTRTLPRRRHPHPPAHCQTNSPRSAALPSLPPRSRRRWRTEGSSKGPCGQRRACSSAVIKAHDDKHEEGGRAGAEPETNLGDAGAAPCSLSR